MLTKILRIDSKLSFDNFHILNHGRISKIEKDIDTLDPPLKTPLFRWGSGTLESPNFRVCLQMRWWCVLRFPGLLYQYHYLYLFYLSYVYTRDSVRALQEIKRTGAKNFNPAYSALRIHYESLRRAGRGLLLLFTYFGKGNYADEQWERFQLT